MGERIGRQRVGVPQTCIHCGATFEIAGTRKRPYCSRACYSKAIVANTFRDGLKLCGLCKEWKVVANFVKTKSSATGYHSWCKPCYSTWCHERRGTPVEDRKPYAPMRLVPMDEKKERMREYGRKRRKLKAAYIAMHNRLRRNRERAGGPLPHPYEIGQMLCAQDARCAYCRVLLSGPYHIDHKMPVSRGGLNGIENLQVTCPTCNMSKGARTHEEFIEALAK